MRRLVPVRGISSSGIVVARKHRRSVRFLVMAFFACVAALALLASPAKAAEFTVTNTKDSGTGSLRDAIQKANNNGQSDTITFDLPDNSTITLTSGQLTIANDVSGLDLSIVGLGARKLAVSGNDSSRIFYIARERTFSGAPVPGSIGAEARIKGLTITNGFLRADVTYQAGGGISNWGTLTLTNSIISDNELVAFGRPGSGFGGGGIFNNGDTGDTLTLINTTVSGNRSTDSGGGIFNFGDTGQTFTLINSTVSGNSSGFAGGGIYHDRGTLTLTNSTVSGNTSSKDGGGIINIGGLAAIENSTIAKNTAPSGHVSGVGSSSDADTRTEVRATIIAGNSTTDVGVPDRSNNTFHSDGSNLIGDGNATGAFDKTGDQRNVSNPRLGLLADNGGPTKTHGLVKGSPAIDAVEPPPGMVIGAELEESCGAAKDQRGVRRPKDGDGNSSAKCDIGSFELKVGEVIQSPPLPPSDPPPTTKPPKNPRACTIKGNNGNNVLRGTPKRDVICGFGGNDTIRGLGGNDLIKGGAGNDIIHGQRGNDRLLGGGGHDVLYGGAGKDRLLGQRGNDALFGGRGRDVLLGGPGKDVLNGGRGKDVERGGIAASKAGQQAKNLVQRILKRAGF